MAVNKNSSFNSSNQLSLASMAGAVFSLGLVVGAIYIGTSDYRGFLSLEGVMIVIGGTLAVAFMSYSADTVFQALAAIGSMFFRSRATHDNLRDDMMNVISWARIVKTKGMRGLEADIGQVTNDPFVIYALDMVVSNYQPEDVRAMMETAAEAYFERDSAPARILYAMASHAPAFGMVGTLIGMVVMLGNFSADMSQIGGGLAISLLATLYGVLTARLIYIPAASMVMQKQEQLRFRNQLIVEGMTMLAANRSPNFIEDRLSSFLKPGLHVRR